MTEGSPRLHVYSQMGNKELRRAGSAMEIGAVQCMNTPKEEVVYDPGLPDSHMPLHTAPGPVQTWKGGFHLSK
jgi:hypothetical protein